MPPKTDRSCLNEEESWRDGRGNWCRLSPCCHMPRGRVGGSPSPSSRCRGSRRPAGRIFSVGLSIELIHERKVRWPSCLRLVSFDGLEYGWFVDSWLVVWLGRRVCPERKNLVGWAGGHRTRGEEETGLEGESELNFAWKIRGHA